MPALERGQTSDCTTPVLDVFFKKAGTPIDVESLEFVIFERVTNPPNLVQTYPPAGRETVDVGTSCPIGHKLSTGRYVAEWTVPVVQVVGDHVITWYYRETLAHPERSFSQEFNVLLPAGAGSPSGYASLAELRAEGVTVGMMSDTVAETKLDYWSRMIERWTGQWFEPRERTLWLDGDGSRSQRIGHPIIRIDEVALVTERGASPVYGEDTFRLEDLIIYNRHLTQGLTRPDDRMRPRLEIVEMEGDLVTPLSLVYFPRGRANIRVKGWFGFTDLRAVDTPAETVRGSQIPVSMGVTPPAIVQLNLLLVIRDQAALADLASREDWMSRWRLTSEKTRDQSYNMAPLQGGAGGMAGAWTGDTVIDGLIASYRVGSRSMAEAV